jgi:hypothetical protein
MNNAYRELARRKVGGVEVALIWTVFDNTITVEIFEANGDFFAFDVKAEEALDAYIHPYAYLALSRLRAARDVRVAATPPAREDLIDQTALSYAVHLHSKGLA